MDDDVRKEFVASIEWSYSVEPEPEEAESPPHVDPPGDPLEDLASAHRESTHDPAVEEWVDRLVAAIRAGAWIDLRPDDEPTPDPTEADQWPSERTIPAAAIRAALLTRDLNPDPRGLQIIGAWIVGALDLDNATIPCQIVVGYSRLAAIHLDGATIAGNLNLRKISNEGGIRALGAAVGGSVSLSGATLTNAGHGALHLDRATIKGSVFLSDGFIADGEVRAPGAEIGGQLDLSGATLGNPGDSALNLDGATIKGGLFLRDGLAVDGQVRALGAEVGGQLSLSGARLTNPGRSVLILDGARIRGEVFLRDGFIADGEVRALGAEVGGQLDLTGARLTNPGRSALNLDGARIRGDMFLSDRFIASGEVRALGAEIDGQVSLSNARLANPGRNALSLDGAKIRSGAFMRGLIADGEVRAPGAEIGGQLALSGATLTNPRKNALNLDRATINRDVFLDDGLAAHGQVRALGAAIGGSLDLSGATLTNPGQDALLLDRATIKGSVFLSGRFAAVGLVRALGAEIGGGLELSDAEIANPGQYALNVEGATIRGAMMFGEGSAVEGKLNLAFVRIGILAVNGPIGQLIATGWRLTDVHGPLTEWRNARTWLTTAPEGSEFAASAWHEFASVYDRQGRPSDAKRLRIAAASQITRNGNWPAKVLRTLYGLFAGYGYWPMLAAAWLVGAVLGAVAVVQFNPWAFTTIDQIQQAIGLNPWVYGTAMVLPAVTIPGLDKWVITEGWVAFSLIGLKLFGWLQTGILLAGLTGLLKKA